MSRRLDHVVVPTTDLDRSADQFLGLGFTVTPRSDHPFGTSNRLVVLGDAYIELVAVTRPDALPRHGFATEVRNALDAGHPISHIVVRSEHPDSDRRDLDDRITDVVEFWRPASLVGGSETRAGFVCLMTGPGDPVGVFLCHHLTPEAVWDAEAVEHANRAQALVGVAAEIGPATRSLLEELELEPPVRHGPPALWIRSDATTVRATVEDVKIRLAPIPVEPIVAE